MPLPLTIFLYFMSTMTAVFGLIAGAALYGIAKDAGYGWAEKSAAIMVAIVGIAGGACMTWFITLQVVK